MIELQQWLFFVPIAFMYIVSPGPAVFLAMTHGALHGPKKTLFTILGNISGIAIIASISALGLGAVIMSSFILFNTIKICGALYLIYLGIKMLRAKKAAITADATPDTTEAPTCAKGKTLYLKGLLMSLSNPKPIIFFTALFPQFVVIEHPMLPQFIVLTGTFMLTSVCTLSCYACIASPVKSLLKNPAKIKLFNRITGSTFIGMGIVVGTQK